MGAYIITFGSIYLIVTAVVFVFSYAAMLDARDMFNRHRYDYDSGFFSFENGNKDKSGELMMRHRSRAMRAPLWPLLIVKRTLADMKDVENVMIEHESKKVRAAVKRERQKALDEFSNIV